MAIPVVEDESDLVGKKNHLPWFNSFNRRFVIVFLVPKMG
jgi:hypothetical protein